LSPFLIFLPKTLTSSIIVLGPHPLGLIILSSCNLKDTKTNADDRKKVTVEKEVAGLGRDLELGCIEGDIY